MAALNVRGLGDYIRDQRVLSQVSLRQLARQAGVSNPYLSQIERGLRKPSAEILQQIAKALRISAEALYIQAGILDERNADGTVPAVVLADATITERQKQVLLEIYDSFRNENDARAASELATAAVVIEIPAAADEPVSITRAPIRPVPAKPAPAKKAPAAKVPPAKAPAKKAPAKKAPAKQAPAKKSPTPRS